MNEQEIAKNITQRLHHSPSLRGVARVLQIEGNSLHLNHSATIIPLHELTADPKVSRRTLHDSASGLNNWLAGHIAYKFEGFEIDAFINGNGINKPRGILSYPKNYRQNWKWGEIECRDTEHKDQISADDLIDFTYDLSPEYRRNACFVMNTNVSSNVRRITDVNGRFVWGDGHSALERPRVLGYPVLICEAMPDIKPGSTPIAFGDFQSGYTIAERPNVRIIRDDVSAKPMVIFNATKKVGGDVVDFAAIKLLGIAE